MRRHLEAGQEGLQHLPLQVLGVAVTVHELVKADVEISVEVKHPGGHIPVRELVFIPDIYLFAHLKHD